MLYTRGELPNAFPWRFTRPAHQPAAPNEPVPFPLPGYKPIARTAAFADMTLQDAKWMARLIGALTDDQIRQALIASGYDSAQTRLYFEKLVSRRDHLILDLGLQNEIPVLSSPRRPASLFYDPTVFGPEMVTVSGKSIRAPTGASKIERGKLVKR